MSSRIQESKLQWPILIVASVFVLGMCCQYGYILSEDKGLVNAVQAHIVSRDSIAHENWTSSRPRFHVQHRTSKPSTAHVTFVYLTQTAECLSSYHLRADMMGSPQDCRCVVVVLSYTTPCTQNPSFSHVRYLFKANTTVNKGRNLLYEYSSTHFNKTGALFFIFIDEDAIIKRTRVDLLDPRARLKVDQKRSILRQYEDFLLRVKPAVSTALYSGSRDSNTFKEDFLSTCCVSKKGKRILFPEFFPMISFDLCMFAVHVIAASNLFPIPLKYETLSWWMGDIIMPFRVYTKYRGQALVYTPMQILNGVHSQYPRVHGGVVGYDVVMNEERDLAPNHLRHNAMWKDPLFRGRRQPPFYSILSPQFPYVPYSKNPNFIPFYVERKNSPGERFSYMTKQH